MKKFLPDMNRLVNLEELNLYLMSENAIGDNDLPKLTVSGHISKPQALLYLQQIIVGRGAFEQFLTALEKSSNDHPGHKELHTMMIEEKRRRTSNAGSYYSITSYPSYVRFNSLSEQGEEVTSSGAIAQQVVMDVRNETLAQQVVTDTRNETLANNFTSQSSTNNDVESSHRTSISNRSSADLQQNSQVEKLLRQSRRKGIYKP